MPIEPTGDPNDPTVYGHERANPMSLKGRIQQARNQLQELAKAAESDDLVVWESICKKAKGGMFMGLEQNLEQIRHGIEELAQRRRKGGSNARGIDKGIGEAKGPAQQAAIAIAMKKTGKKPKGVAENVAGDVNSKKRYHFLYPHVPLDMHTDHEYNDLSDRDLQAVKSHQRELADKLGKPGAEKQSDIASHIQINRARSEYDQEQAHRRKVLDAEKVKRQAREAKRKQQGVAEATGATKHRIGLTVTDPNHPMVSKRGETYQKSVRITGDDREKAINSAIAHYRRKGYKVHDHNYMGTVDQGVAEAFPNPGSGSTGSSKEDKRIAAALRKKHIPSTPNDKKKGVAEGSGDKKPYPNTWHDVDPKLGKQVDKMSPEEKVKKGYANPSILKKNKQQGVAEGHGSEELANEVYAEFERTYPNLARRADERTVHAAIMDVLNYGGDSNPSALAQDVARAVKQEMQQGVAEGKIDFAKKLQKNVDKSNKAVVKTRQDIGSRIADIGAGGKEYNVKTDAAWDAAKKKVAEGSAPKEKQKTPYRDINGPEYKAAADKQKEKMAKDKEAEPGKKLADNIDNKKK